MKNVFQHYQFFAAMTFTKHLNERININALLDFSPPFVTSVSLWIKQHENDCKSSHTFLSIKQIREICEKYQEYSVAVVHSYDFYEAAKPVTPQSAKSPIHDIIAEKVKNNKMDPQFLALVKSGIMWRYEIEQIDKALPCIHDILQLFVSCYTDCCAYLMLPNMVNVAWMNLFH